MNHASRVTPEDVENISFPVWFNFSGPSDAQVSAVHGRLACCSQPAVSHQGT